MDGDFECDDLGALLAVATANAHQIEVGWAAWVGRGQGWWGRGWE